MSVASYGTRWEQRQPQRQDDAVGSALGDYSHYLKGFSVRMMQSLDSNSHVNPRSDQTTKRRGKGGDAGKG
eukprot:gene7345-466_t